MRKIIEIEKDLLPYNFDIVLAGEEFNMAFMYNKTADLFTCTLSKNKEVLVYNEPIIYGVEMFADVYKSGVFPMISIVPLDEACIETAVTHDNLGKTVFLMIDDQEESIAEMLVKAEARRNVVNTDSNNSDGGNTTSVLGVCVLGVMVLGSS